MWKGFTIHGKIHANDAQQVNVTKLWKLHRGHRKRRTAKRNQMIDWLKRVSMDRLISLIDTINSVQIVMRIDTALWMYPCIPQRAGPKCHDKTHLDCLPFHFVPSDDYYLSRVFRRNFYNFKRYSIPIWTMAQWDKEAAAAHPNKNDEHTISSFRYDDSFRQFFTIIYFYLFFARFFYSLFGSLFEMVKPFYFVARKAPNNDDVFKRVFISVSDILILIHILHWEGKWHRQT